MPVVKSNIERVLQIRTPEGVEFSQTLASPLSRMLALLIDFAAVNAIVVTIGSLLTILAIVSAEWAVGLSTIVSFVVQLGYFIVLEWRLRGQTLGKRVLRLRVIDADGLRLALPQVAIRNLVRVVDFLPCFYLLGGLVALANRNYQRLGDLAANTVVIHVAAVSEPNLTEILNENRYNSFREYPHLETRLRQTVSPEEAKMAVEALRRVREFSDEHRILVFQTFADHFRALVTFPVEEISDEQYVRNAVDSIYRRLI